MCKCNSKREIREHIYKFYNSSYIKHLWDMKMWELESSRCIYEASKHFKALFSNMFLETCLRYEITIKYETIIRGKQKDTFNMIPFLQCNSPY